MARVEKIQRIPEKMVEEVIESFKREGAANVHKEPESDGSWTVEAKFADELFVLPNALNLRAGPGVEHQSVSVLRVGTRVVPLETEGKWCRVRVIDSGKQSGLEGWVFNEFISTSPRTAAG